jgi:hypothetical protein
MINQLIEDVHNGSNYTTITTAGAGYKDVVGFHSDKQGSNMQCTVSLFVCGGWRGTTVSLVNRLISF